MAEEYASMRKNVYIFAINNEKGEAGLLRYEKN